jgi:hypothetical protein
MMFAPEFELRTGFHSTMFLTVGSAAAMREIWEPTVNRRPQWLEAVACGERGLEVAWGAQWLEAVACGTPWRRAITLTAASIVVAYGLFVLIGSLVVETSYRRQFDERLSYVKQHRDADMLVVPHYQIPYHLDSYLGPRSITDFHLIYAADLESKTTDNRSLMYARYYGLPPIRIDREVDWKKRNEN